MDPSQSSHGKIFPDAPVHLMAFVLSVCSEKDSKPGPNCTKARRVRLFPEQWRVQFAVPQRPSKDLFPKWDRKLPSVFLDNPRGSTKSKKRQLEFLHPAPSLVCLLPSMRAFTAS